MSAIFGILRFDGGEVARRDLERMGAAMRNRGPDAIGYEALGSVGLGQCLLRVNREDRFEHQPLFDDAADLALVADCRVDNRELLAEQFGWAAETLPQQPDSAFVLEAYRRWGEACPERLLGDFAFAIWDGRTKRLFLARDHMGQRYVHLHHGPGFFAFATEWAGLFALPDVPKRFREDVFARRLFGDGARDVGSTIYEQVTGLAGGTSLWIDRKGVGEARTYWTPKPAAEHLDRDETHYVEAYRRVFEEAVLCRTRRLARPPALLLSGGVDSGAIAAIAGAALSRAGQRLVCVASVAKSSGYRKDARPAVERCARAMPWLDVHYFTRGEETIFDGLETKFEALGPVNLEHYTSFPMMKLARETGARLLMDGMGGDYTINYRGPIRWRVEPRLESLRRIWADSRAIMRRSRGHSLGELRALRNEVLPLLMPPAAADAWRSIRRGFRPLWRDRFVARSAGRGLITSRAVDPRRVRGLRTVRGSNLGWMSRILDNTRRGAAPMDARSAGIEGLDLTRPFHDPRVVELALAIPEHYHLKEGRFRHLARRALADLLPTEILENEGANSALDPDRAAMRQAVLERAMEETYRLQAHPMLEHLVDFPGIRRLLCSARPRRGAALKVDAALQTILLSKFMEWATGRNQAVDRQNS